MTVTSPDNPSEFVVQHHTGAGHDHFDLMLRRGEVLWTWQLDRLPAGPGDLVPAERIADHRLAYLTCEGPISGNRGNCRIVDRGPMQWNVVEATRIEVELQGMTLVGRFQLEQTGQGGKQWQLRRTITE